MKLDDKRLWRMARHLAYQLATHEGPDELAQDLYMAAWEKYLSLKKEIIFWKDLEWAMLEEVSRWLYQCKRGRGKDRLMKIKLGLLAAKVGTDTLTPERIMLIQEEYKEACKDRRKFPTRHYEPRRLSTTRYN